MANQWNAAEYCAKHAFVYEKAKGLVELLAPKAGERILDLGCGTGALTAEIAARGAEALGVDRSEEMIAQARKKFPELRFEVMDARELRFRTDAGQGDGVDEGSTKAEQQIPHPARTAGIRDDRLGGAPAQGKRDDGLGGLPAQGGPGDTLVGATAQDQREDRLGGLPAQSGMSARPADRKASAGFDGVLANAVLL